jgi:hypothetical protein
VGLALKRGRVRGGQQDSGNSRRHVS